MKSCTECIYSGSRVNPDKSIGQVCRRNPPTCVAFPIPGRDGVQLANVTVWPTVEDSDWCSEYASKLNG